MHVQSLKINLTNNEFIQLTIVTCDFQSHSLSSLSSTSHRCSIRDEMLAETGLAKVARYRCKAATSRTKNLAGTSGA